MFNLFFGDVNILLTFGLPKHKILYINYSANEQIRIEFMTISEKLSSTQSSILVTQSKYSNSVMYNIGGYACINGGLDTSALEDSILKHLYHCNFFSSGCMFTGSKSYPAVQFIDYSGSVAPSVSCLSFINEDMTKGMDMHNCLIEVYLLKASDLIHYWYVKAHHIALDGYSMSLLFNSVVTDYTSRNNGAESSIQLFPFTDFIADELAYKASDEYFKDMIFWKNKLQGISGNNAFNSCMQVTFEGSLVSKRKELVIPRCVFNEIEKFCVEKAQCTVYHYFLAVLILQNRLYNNEDSVVGIPVFNRWNKKHKHTLGTFVNVFPFLTEVGMDDSFTQLLTQVKQVLKECYRHQKFPFADLSGEKNISQELYNIIFSYQKNNYSPKLGTADCEIKFIHNGEQLEDLKIHLLEYSTTENPVLLFDYKPARFTEDMINDLIEHFNILLKNCMYAPAAKISGINMLQTEEQDRILNVFNNTSSPYAKNKNIVMLFEECAAAIPEEIALVSGNTVLSYTELNEKANRMADYFKKNYRVQPGEIIGVQLERNEWIVITLLAVLKSGAAYVPVDNDYPPERIAYLLEDSRCRILVDEKELNKFKVQADKYSGENKTPEIAQDQLAYIIYTSGSTGKPKGVMIGHCNLTAFIHWCKAEFSASDFDTVLAVTSVCFDLSVFEIFYTLSAGKKIHLLKNGLAVPAHLKVSSKILLNTVPSVVGALIAEQMDFSTVSVLNMAGEPIPRNYIDHFDCDRIEVRNLYGPSEDTTYSTCFRIKNESVISIGRPILNSKIYIVDRYDNLLPVGVAGEICIAGDGLAGGYLHRPELTAAKFVPDHFNPGRMYKTGDEGRWLQDGTIEFLGRSDNQVKIRGYRIELEEIENVLRNYEAVKHAVVHPKMDASGEKILVAYFTGDAEVDTYALRAYMQEMLPGFMQPVNYIRLDQLPLTSNGKVDRKALPDPEVSSEAEESYIAPETETEQKLAAVWGQLLGRERIGRFDDFFALGGHSLKTMNLLSKIQLTFDVQLELQMLFKKTVLTDQALLIAQSDKKAAEPILQLQVMDNYPLSSSQHRLWVVSLFDGDNSSYNMTGSYILKGSPDREMLQSAFNYIIGRHEILRTSFREDKTGEIKQFILPKEQVSFPVSYSDIRKVADKDKKLASLLKEEASTSFDMAHAPLMRSGLVQVSDQEFVFTFTMHHIIGDGWSIEILIRELVQMYNLLSGGRPLSLPGLRIHFKDYSDWIGKQVLSGRLEHQRRYWVEQLKGELSPLRLNYDRPPSANDTFKGSSVHFSLQPELIEKVKGLALNYQITEFTVHLAVFKTLLFATTSVKDIIIGMPAAGREHPELEGQLGFYVNVLPLRTIFEKNKLFSEILMTLGDTMSAALNNQMYPMDLLIEELKFNREGGRSGFINAGFTWNSNDFERIRLNDQLELTAFPVKSEVVKNDLWMIGTGKNFSIEYRTDLFNTDTIEIFAERYRILLEQVCENVNQPLDQYDLSIAAEKRLESKKIKIQINF